MINKTKSIAVLTTVLLVATVLPAASAAPDPPAYKVVFDHPIAAGQVIKGDIHSRQRQYVVADGVAKLAQPTGYSEARAKYQMTVGSVDSRGIPVVAVLRLDELFASSDTVDLPAKSRLSGKVLVRIPRNSGQYIREDGIEVSTRDSDIVGALFGGFFESDTVTDDEMFAPRGTIRVGETWAGNSAAIAKMVSGQLNTTIQPEHTKGTAKLNGIVTRVGVPCLDITLRIDVDYIANPPVRLGYMGVRTLTDDAVKIDSATYIAEQRAFCPVDTQLPELETCSTLTYKLKTHVDGKPVEMNFERVLDGRQNVSR
ncbi:MAG TPA: hypothetical protein VGK19_08340 [Capsulimonadaceae bacterium]|jgi:hypothetical protein